MNRVINRVGFFSGILAFSFTILYCIVQALQLYDLVKYPTDEILIYSTSLLIVIPFVLEVLALHSIVPIEKRFWSQGALIFATCYAILVSINYVVQLSTVIPMTLKGRLDDVRIFQQTPHSVFWDLDGLGYVFMGLCTAFAIPIFKGRGLQKWIRVTFIANALVTPLIAIVYFYPNFSIQLLLLGFPWAITTPLSMLLLALFFKRNLSKRRQELNQRIPMLVLADVDESEEY